MNLKQALKRIEELERKVKELEARPAQQIHYHYTQLAYYPLYAPAQPFAPNQKSEFLRGNVSGS